MAKIVVKNIAKIGEKIKKKNLEKGGVNSIPSNRGYPPLFYKS